jgi:mono/diheme cytochrome c family protein
MTRGYAPLRHRGIPLCFVLVFLGFGFSIMARQTAPKGTIAPADSARMALDAQAASLIKINCAGCHGGKHPRMRLDLEPETLVAEVMDVPSRQIDSLKLVDTRTPEKSYLLMKIRGDKGIKGSQMPDSAPALSVDEIRRIDLWVHVISRPPGGSRTAPSAADSTRKK